MRHDHVICAPNVKENLIGFLTAITMICPKRDARNALNDLCKVSDTFLLQERDPGIKY